MNARSAELRKGRVSIPGHYYAVTFVTRHRKPIFLEFEPARTAARLISQFDGAKTVCFVIMPDHVHWLMGLKEERSLSNAVRSVKGVCSRRINQLSARTGPVWQPGFHDHAVRREENIRTLARYIVGNPVRAGLVARVGDYPYWDAMWMGRR